MRQSSRQKKAVEVYTDVSMKRPSSTDLHESDDEATDNDRENRVNKTTAQKTDNAKNRGADDDEDEEENDDDTVNYKVKKTSAKKRKSLQDADDEDADGDDWGEGTKAARKPHRASPSNKQAKTITMTGNALYDIINRTSSSESAVDAAKQGIKKWLGRYEKDKVSALMELLNSVLYASGANDDYIQSDINLDIMEKNDFYEMLHQIGEALVESGADATDYPLKRKANSAKSSTFRSRYANFWSLFSTEMICSIVDSDYFEGCIGMEVLSAVIDRFINLSIIGLASVRDGVTEAAISIGKCLLIASLEIKRKVETVERQRIVLQESLATKTGDKLNDLNKKYRRFESALRCLSALSVLIFQSFFVHRLRDVNDDIRAMCSAYVGDWLRLDPDEWYKDEYLKYLGWMCADHCNKVRFETIGSVAKLIETSEASHLGLLRKFFDRHMERFVEIITQDIDAEVSLAATKLICALQSKGVLTDESELLVDRVDSLVFDKEISLDIRCEVFSFFRGHAIGFEDTPEHTDRKKRGRITEDLDDDDDDEERKALSVTLTKQKNALQLKTLCEFAKYHLDGSKGFDGAVALAEVCLQSPIRHVLLDWPTITTLLLEESHGAVDSQEEGAELNSYLLPMFVHSAKALQAEMTNSGENAESGTKPRKGKGYKSLSPAGIAWASLTEQLNKDLCKLMLRYRDDSHNIKCLLGLLVVYDVGDIKTFKALLKAVVDLLHSSPSEDVRKAIVGALRKWSVTRDKGDALSSTVSMLKVLYARLWKETIDNLQAISSSSKRKISDEDLKEHLYSLISSVSKFSLLWKNIDCREYLAGGDSTNEIVDVLARISRFVTSSFRSSEVYRLFGFDHGALGTLASSCAMTAYSIVLWHTRDAFVVAKAHSKKNDKEVEEAEEGLSATIDCVEETRRRLLEEFLLDWMALTKEEVPDHVDRLLESADWSKFSRGGHYDKNDPFASIWETSGLASESESGVDATRLKALERSGMWLLHRTLPREAFRMIGDLRLLFNQGNFNYKILDRFVWSPSDEINSMMKRVFEVEGELIAQDLERCPEDKQQSLSNIITTFLIQPMSYAFYIDSENMNRRQASAVICYLLNSDESIVFHVKQLLRILQKSDLQKCLEVNIGALQAVYATKFERLIDEYEQSDEDERNYFDDKELLAGYESVARLAKILASILLEIDQSTRTKKSFLRGMEQFFQAVTDIALSHRSKFCFLILLENFMPLLSNKQRAELSDDVVGKLNDLNDFDGDLAFIGSLSSKLKRRFWKVVTEFQSFASIEFDRGGKKRRGMDKEEEDEGEEEEGEEEEEEEEEEDMDLAGPLRGLAVGEFSNKQISLGRFAEQEDEDDEEMEEDAYLSRRK